MAMPQPPTALFDDYSSPPAQYQLLSSKMMVAAIILLFIVVFIILLLHIYAKWFWRSRSLSATITTRRLQRLHFIGQEMNPAAAHNIGLDKSAIDQLPAFIYKAPTAAGEREEGLAFLECAVCLSEFQENDKGRLLPTCKHSFHTDCIDMWLYSHSTCPLCRALVMPTPLSSVTVEQQLQEEQGEELQRGGGDATPSTPPNEPVFTAAHEGLSTIPSTINHGNAMQYPSNVLFWGNHTQFIASEGSFSSQRLERPSSSSSPPTTRAIPQITIEIPRRQDMNLTSPSPNDQVGSSQPIKSPGLRMSIKRILSREASKEKRIIGSNQDGGDSPQTKNTPRLSV